MYLKQPFINIKNGVVDQRETEMMSVRWKIFQFNVQIEQNDQKEIFFLFCPRYAAQRYLLLTSAACKNSW